MRHCFCQEQSLLPRVPLLSWGNLGQKRGKVGQESPVSEQGMRMMVGWALSLAFAVVAAGAVIAVVAVVQPLCSCLVFAGNLVSATLRELGALDRYLSVQREILWTVSGQEESLSLREVESRWCSIPEGD